MTKRNSYLIKKFGITDADYEDLFRRQKGCCAVCKKPSSSFKRRLAVDHDHHSGEIRGLLCLRCNRYLVGRHRRETGAELLKAAYEYLTAEYTGWTVPPKVKRKKRRCKQIKKKSKIYSALAS